MRLSPTAVSKGECRDATIAKSVIHGLFSGDISVPCTIRFWDGEVMEFGKGVPAFELHLKCPGAFQGILDNPSIGFGEAYMRGDIDVHGDLGALLRLAYERDLFSRLSLGQKARLCWLHLRQRSGLKQARKDVQAHYDRGNEFYRLWLDESMSYSCAYFQSRDESLECAQLNKIHHTLKKLKLRLGQRLLDVGCGWGSLLIEAAKHYGVSALGLTLSENQVKLGQRRIEKCGLSDKAMIRLKDYREMSYHKDGHFDRIVSIGMFEHVGKANIHLFFKKMAEIIKPGGILLLHTICRIRPDELDPWLKKYIFPGGYIPAISEVMESADKCGFDFVDLEDLRQHYDLTIGHWIKRFEDKADEIRRVMGERFVRMWRLYLYGSQMAFRHGPMHVCQFLFSLGRRNDWPLVREDLYRNVHAPHHVH